MGVKGVIFDFDGVIVDSLPVHLATWQDAVREIFRQELADPETIARHATRTIAAILAKRFGDSSLAGPLARAKAKALATRAGEMPLIPGARELLGLLRERRIPYGIASNSARDFVGHTVVALGLGVQTVVTGDEVARGKPHPAIFWECANRLGIEPHDRAAMLVLEDSPHGLEAARRAGMIPVGIASTLSERELRDAGAVEVCPDLTTVAPLLLRAF